MQLYIHRHGQRTGPYTPEEVRSSLAAGSVQSSDLAWHEGAPDWAPLASIPGIGIDMPPSIPRQIIPPPPPPLAAPTSNLAIASIVLGAGGLATGILAIPAVICGHVSRSQIKRAAGRLSGGGLAMAGLIMGYLEIAFMLLMTVVVIMVLASTAADIGMPNLRTAFDTAFHSARCFTHATQISYACKAYAKDHNGRYPESLIDLVPKYVPNRETLTCPMLKNTSILGYEYFPGKDTDPGTKILLISKGKTFDNKPVVVSYNGQIVNETGK